MIDIKNLMMGGFDYVKNYGLRFFISNDIWNIKNKFSQQYSVVPNEQQFCTETIKSSKMCIRDRYISEQALEKLSGETKIFRIALDTIDSSYDKGIMEQLQSITACLLYTSSSAPRSPCGGCLTGYVWSSTYP